MIFDDNKHQFRVSYPAQTTVGLDFGPKRFITSLSTISNVSAIDAALSANTAIFGSSLIPQAIKFEASCVVPGKINAPLTSAQLSAMFEFGIVQGITQSDINLDYWAARKSDGRVFIHFDMPNSMEIDTTSSVNPWTRVEGKRCRFEDAQANAGVKVIAESDDHPMYVFNHTITTGGKSFFLRSVTCKQSFRTVFCFRERASGKFTAISSAAWQIQHDITVSYTNNGANRTVTDNISRHSFPSGGSPSNVNGEDRRLMDMAKDGFPAMTPELLNMRLGNGPGRNIEHQDTNEDFDDSFWK